MISSHFPFTSPLVYFAGPAYTTSSIGAIVSYLGRELRKSGVPAFTGPLNPGHKDTEFFHSRHLLSKLNLVSRTVIEDFIYINPSWDLEESLALYARRAISILAIDDYRAYSRREAVRHYDVIASFSRSSCAALEKILKRKVSYFPLGVDTSKFFPLKAKLPKLEFLFKNFSFPLESFQGYVFFNANFHQERKGTKELLDAYLKAFSGNPTVLLLVHGPQCDWADQRQTSYLASFNKPNAPLIAWTKNILSVAEMNHLYNFSDCYVSPHHLEGFGFGPLQALACNKAVIATAASGPMDYLTPSNSLLLPAKEDWKQVENCGKFPWASYKQDDLVSLLRTFPEPKPNALSTARKWSWERSAKYFTKFLGYTGKIVAPREDGDCTIVIICRDGDPLEKCLASLSKNPTVYTHQILVVNDGASESTISILRSFPYVRELKNPTPQGTSYARNLALSSISSTFVLFLDADIEVLESHWLRSWITQHKEVKATVSTVLHIHPDGTVNFDNSNGTKQAGNFGKKVDISSYSPMPIPYCQGSGLLTYTKIAQEYGFCEDFTYYYDDVDFCYYVRANGGTCWYLNATRLIHNARHLRRKDEQLSPKQFGESTFDLYWKNASLPSCTLGP